MATITVSSSEWHVAPYWSVTNGSTMVASSSIAVDDTLEFNQITVIDTDYLDEPVGPDAPATYFLGDVRDSNNQDFLIQCEGPITISTGMFDWSENPKFTVYSIEDQGIRTVYVRQKTSVPTDKALGYNAVAFLKDKIENAYTAGTNVSISGGVISATDTTYSNFTGTDGVDPGVAGLVPAPTTSDTDKYLKSDGTWATVSGGGGGGGTLYSGTGQNTDGAMTQKATTDMVFNSNTKTRIQIGSSASANANNSVAIGASAAVNSNQNAVAIGTSARVTGSSHTYATSLGSQAACAYSYSVALGSYATPRAQGVVDVSTGNGANGYQGTGEATRSKLRVISGVHDGEDDHDAATIGQTLQVQYLSQQPTNTTPGKLGSWAIWNEVPDQYTTIAHLYFCVRIVNYDPDHPEYTWQQLF